MRLRDFIPSLSTSLVDLNTDDVHPVALKTRASALKKLYLPATVLGADLVVAPDEQRRAARRLSGSLALESGDGEIERLTGGVDLVVDCVVMATALLVIGNFIADILLAWSDPRIRLK